MEKQGLYIIRDFSFERLSKEKLILAYTQSL